MYGKNPIRPQDDIVNILRFTQMPNLYYNSHYQITNPIIWNVYICSCHDKDINSDVVPSLDGPMKSSVAMEFVLRPRTCPQIQQQPRRIQAANIRPNSINAHQLTSSPRFSKVRKPLGSGL